MTDTYSDLRVFRVRPLCRWWRLTERAARRMVWVDLGWTSIGECQERAGYRKAKVGYWVTLEQWRWERENLRWQSARFSA